MVREDRGRKRKIEEKVQVLYQESLRAKTKGASCVPLNYAKILRKKGIKAKEAKYADKIFFDYKDDFRFENMRIALSRRKEYKKALIALLENGFLEEHSICGEKFKDIAFMDRRCFYIKFTWTKKAVELRNIAEKIRDLRVGE